MTAVRDLPGYADLSERDRSEVERFAEYLAARRPTGAALTPYERGVALCETHQIACCSICTDGTSGVLP